MHFPKYHVKLELAGNNEALSEGSSFLKDRYLETTRQMIDERRAHTGIKH